MAAVNGAHDAGCEWLHVDFEDDVEPIFRDVAPQRAETLTPAEARDRFGTMPPRELYEILALART